MSREHLGDVLSALLDGELSPAERAAAGAHLADCPACTAELRLAEEGRALVRELPPVEPPATFFPVLFGRRRRRRAAVAMAAAAVAGIALVGMRPPSPAPVTPPVNQLVQDHAATASVAGDPVSELVPVGVPVSFSR